MNLFYNWALDLGTIILSEAKVNFIFIFYFFQNTIQQKYEI